MPIGKNAIKRVTNNGYSNVKSSAPDMENSVIEEKKSAPAAVKKNPAPKADAKKNTAPKAAVAKSAVTKKAAPKKASENKPAEKPAEATPEVKKSLEKEPVFSPVNTAEKVVAAPEKENAGYTNLGRDLPYYLL